MKLFNMNYTLQELDLALKNIRNKITYYEGIMYGSQVDDLKEEAERSHKIHCAEFEKLTYKYNIRLNEIINS